MAIQWKELGSGGATGFSLIEEHVVSMSYNGSLEKTDAKIFKNNGNESITIKAYCERGLAHVDFIASYGTGIYTLESIYLTNTETEYTVSLINPSGGIYEEFTIETIHNEASTVTHMRIV